ncbi:hypothetical protein MIND_00910400 [Mycena indigotica]|uniref:DUF202 domain-containing protein n=1 Tax=Mycena indigotica TaxID=2126181 RepID=A0A8H6SCB6_9AGAR|nr:uncharacterized protein MIND_00910400 [Mycena indigotica]KAF7296794.1 hypothetical protein MIND_00910400 [Mycena indigotica]
MSGGAMTPAMSTAAGTPVSRHSNYDDRTPLLSASYPSLHSFTDRDADTSGLGDRVIHLTHRPSFRSFVLDDDPDVDDDHDTVRSARLTPKNRLGVPLLILENRGSVARDHLASERTFLAYVRTSLAIAAAGVALVQLFLVSSSDTELGLLRTDNGRLKTYGRPLAIASIVLALYLLAVGVSRYFSIQAALVDGNFPVSRFRVGFLTAALASLIVAMFAVLLVHAKF